MKALLERLKRDLKRREEIGKELDRIYIENAEILKKFQSLYPLTEKMKQVNSDPVYSKNIESRKELYEESANIKNSYPEMEDIFVDIAYESSDFEDFLIFAIRLIENNIHE